MGSSTVRVKGLRELNRAFGKIDRNLKVELREELKKAGEPVRSTAESLAQSQIRNMTPRWSVMKVRPAVTAVFVGPKARRAGGSPRPNLNELMMRKSLEPALDKERAKVLELVDVMLGRLGGEAGF